VVYTPPAWAVTQGARATPSAVRYAG